MIQKFRFYVEDYEGHIYVIIADKMTDIIDKHIKAVRDKEYRFVSAVICYSE